MASFSESSFAKKLSDLNNSQQSIQTLSLWLIHHRKHAKSVAKVWIEVLKQAPPKQKLLFFYLANDVVQNSKKKGPELNGAFRTVLQEGYKHCVSEVDEKTKLSMMRLTNIWAERGVFGRDFIATLRKILAELPSPSTPVPLDSASTSTPSSQGSSSHSQKENDRKTKSSRKDKKREESKKKEEHKRREDGKKKEDRRRKHKEESDAKETPAKKKKSDAELSLARDIETELKNRVLREVPEAEELVKVLTDLEHAASFDAVVREKIAALPPEVSDTTVLTKLQDRESVENLCTKVDSAVSLLAEYNQRLHNELEDRKKMAIMLRDFIEHQKEQVEKDKAKLEEAKAKLSKVAAIRVELQSHLSSMPDLTLLPNLTGGLAPLPSAGDLFSGVGEM